MHNLSEVATLVDIYIKLREERLGLERQADAIKEQEQEHKAKIMAALQESGASAVAGKTHRITLRSKHVPTVQDWRLFYDYIKKFDAFELLQRRLSAPAVQEYWEAGDAIDGVMAMEVVDVSINKL